MIARSSFDNKYSTKLTHFRNSTNAAAEVHRSHADSDRLLQNEEANVAPKSSVIRPLREAFGASFVFSIVLKLTQDFLTFVSPQILK
jgi:hypothetical protein